MRDRIEIVGNLSGGGIVTETISFSFLDWEQFVLGSSFTNLDSVVFTALGSGPGAVNFLIDDIVVNAPEPNT